MADAGRGDDVEKATYQPADAEVEFDPKAQRWYVTVGGKPLDDANGLPLHWLDYSAAYAVKTGLEAAVPTTVGFAFGWSER